MNSSAMSYTVLPSEVRTGAKLALYCGEQPVATLVYHEYEKFGFSEGLGEFEVPSIKEFAPILIEKQNIENPPCVHLHNRGEGRDVLKLKLRKLSFEDSYMGEGNCRLFVVDSIELADVENRHLIADMLMKLFLGRLHPALVAIPYNEDEDFSSFGFKKQARMIWGKWAGISQ